MEETDFYPVYALKNSTAVDAKTSAKFARDLVEKFKHLVDLSTTFSDYMMLENGVYFTREDDTISFHDIWNFKLDEIPCSIFLAFYLDGGEMFSVKSKYILTLSLYSDLSTYDEFKKLNEEKNKAVGYGRTIYYIGENIRKLVMIPNAIEDDRTSLVRKNKLMKVVESEITEEDLEILEKSANILKKTIKASKNSKHLAISKG